MPITCGTARRVINIFDREKNDCKKIRIYTQPYCLYKHINIDDTIVHLGTNGRFFDDTFDYSHDLN